MYTAQKGFRNFRNYEWLHLDFDSVLYCVMSGYMGS